MESHQAPFFTELFRAYVRTNAVARSGVSLLLVSQHVKKSLDCSRVEFELRSKIRNLRCHTLHPGWDGPCHLSENPRGQSETLPKLRGTQHSSAQN